MDSTKATADKAAEQGAAASEDGLPGMQNAEYAEQGVNDGTDSAAVDGEAAKAKAKPIVGTTPAEREAEVVDEFRDGRDMG